MGSLASLCMPPEEVDAYIDGALLNTAVVIESISHGREGIQKGAKRVRAEVVPLLIVYPLLSQ